MKKRSIGFIIGLMGLALLGVVAMQYYFLRQSYQLQTKLFDRDVSDALSTVVSKLTRQDANRFLNNKAGNLGGGSNSSVFKRIEKKTYTTGIAVTKDDAQAAGKARRAKKMALLRDSLKHMLNRKKVEDELYSLNPEDMVNVRIHVEEFTDEFGILHQRMAAPEIISRVPGRYLRKPVKLHKYDTIYYPYSDPQFGRQLVAVTSINPAWQREQEHQQKARRLAQVKQMLTADSIAHIKENESLAHVTVMETLAEEYKKSDEPLKARINTIWIDSLLRFELHNKGIFLPYSYEVATASNDSLIFSKAMDMKGERPVFTAADTYQTPIFTQDVINDPGKIRIFFPQKNAHILNTMTYTLGISGGLLLVLVVCFGYTIFIILRQKKISEMKTDFINNMTHEFKTPVSTIMIASEALKDQDIVADKARVARLADIIYEENERLGSHIERVLNIAKIEKNDFKLDTKPVDVNELITDVVDSMSLKLQKYNAKVEVRLNAGRPVIEADELHFSNVIYNLIDNAIKYSRDEPELTISTVNNNNQLLIRVADKGIGMTRDQQAKIFEQFYRVPTGNLHDVKGFGLGLSYVNTIVKRLDGTISVKSEKEKGSEFELKFNTAA